MNEKTTSLCGRLRILTDDQLKQIHQATLEILEKTGVQVECDEALRMLKKAGADTRDPGRVKLPKALVEEMISYAPKSIKLYTRDGKVAMDLGGNRVYYGAHIDAPMILDSLTSNHRKFVTEDAGTLGRVCDALPNIDFISFNGFGDDEKDFRQAIIKVFRHTTINSAKPLGFGCGDAEIFEDVLEMARSIVGGDDNLRAKPFFYHYSEPTTPLIHSTPSLQRLFKAVDSGIPCVYTPMLMFGATAPASFAAELALANAENLSGITIAQLRQKGAKNIYGGIPSIMDMQTTICSYGAPEMDLMAAAFTDMAHFYQIPMFGTAGCTDSKQVDQQAAIESAVSCLSSLLSGANLVHDTGFTEYANCVSAEMMVMTDEIIGMLRQYARGIEVSPETLQLDLINKVGPGGNFLAEDHTLEHFKDVWFPNFMGRARYTDGEAENKNAFYEKINAKAKALIQNHKPLPISKEILKKISA